MTMATMTRTETTDRLNDEHFTARMERASSEERDAVFADLATQVDAGSELAARTIRQLLLPTCRTIAGDRSSELLDAVVDAAYEEVLDWARTR